MDAIVFHAAGDELVASDVCAKLAPLVAVEVLCDPNSTLRAGSDIVCVAVWSQVASALGFEEFYAELAARHSLFVLAQTDGAAAPRLAGGASFSLQESPEAVAAVIKSVRRTAIRNAPIAAVSAQNVGGAGWAVGFGAGVAIYAGMFAAASVWRGEAVSQAIEANNGPIVVADAVRDLSRAFAEAPQTPRANVARVSAKADLGDSYAMLQPARASASDAAGMGVIVRRNDY